MTYTPENTNKSNKTIKLETIHWDWLKVTVSGIHHEQTPIQRSDIVFLYEKMSGLVEAAHAINEEQRKPGKVKK